MQGSPHKMFRVGCKIISTDSPTLLVLWMELYKVRYGGLVNKDSKHDDIHISELNFDDCR